MILIIKKITYIFKRESELCKVGRVIQLGTVQQTPGPRVDGGHGVGGGWLALLVHAVVTCHRAMGCFRLHRAPIGAHKH